MTANTTISDQRTTVVFDGRTGGLRSLAHATLGTFSDAGDAAELYVLEIPHGGDRTVCVRTGKQVISAVETSPDGRSVLLRWNALLASDNTPVAGEVRVMAKLDGAGRLLLAFGADLPDAGVEAVHFPSIAGVAPESGNRLDWRGVDYSQGTRVELLPHFENNSPYWGTEFPDYASSALRPEVICNPTSPFVQLDAGPGGLLIRPAHPTLEFIGWRASLVPGYRDSMTRTPAEAATVTFDAIHLPDVASNRIELPEMSVGFYEGKWTSAVPAMRAGQGPTRRSPASWLEEPRAWLQVQLMSTERDPRYTFDDLIEIIEECAEQGIGAIQIVGWNEGGQDGLVPVHIPAEKLGGEAGLRRALARARELDVKTVLYVKYQWVEKPGPYWDDFATDICLDANRQPYAQPGPVYLSSRKRYGVNTPWYVPLCFSRPALRRRFAQEVAGLARWGADGILADESLYHGRALLCFADDHSHAPGASTYLWDGDFVEDIRRAAAVHNADFVIAAEGCYDAQYEHYDVSYFRSHSPRHVPTARMLRPRARIVTALIGFDDRNLVNQALLDGYGMSLEPFNFKGRPGDMPDTVAYARDVDRLRTRLAPMLWNGVIQPDGGAAVGVTVTDASTGGLPAEPAVQWSMWRDEAGRAAIVVVNAAEHGCELALSIPELREPVVLRPDGLVVDGSVPAEPLGSGLVLPPRSAAVIVDAGRNE
jgi:hypothetical protein